MTPEQEQTAARVLDPAARFQHAIDLAYRYLGYRDRTVVELRRHLESKRVEPRTIDEVVAELQVQGYVDDARFAVRFAEDRRTLDAWGADRIERKLLQAGVSPEHIAAALAAQDGEEELDAAVALLRRRYRDAPETDRERERALGMLVRKGYALELAYDAVRAFERDRLVD
ncbi:MULTISPECIES: regulatory protein RecX [Solirubrobacterales]|uniref:regulatory protein RecX n=1 Tax=Solirubrobacterales TaxID=588673 RepID=UPI0012B98541|nr:MULTISPECIES: RecX family transcriptional regulator [Solirubrobacterales]